MARTKDTQAKKVYGAESPLRALYGTDLTSLELRRFVRKIMRSKFVERNFPKAVGELEVKEITRNRQAARGWYGGIEIPPWAANKVVVIHEIAHAIAQRQYGMWVSHGREFCNVYLKLVRRFLGKDAYEVLLLNFRSHRVKYRLPRQKRELSQAQEAALALGRVAMRKAKMAARPPKLVGVP